MSLLQCRSSIVERYKAEGTGAPNTRDEWIVENIDLEAGTLSRSCVHALQLLSDVEDFMIVPTTHPFSGRNGQPFKRINAWLVQRILDQGQFFYYGHLTDQTGDGPLTTFDVDKPAQVLVPFGEGMDENGAEWNGRLPTMQAKRISWVVEEVHREDIDNMMIGQNALRNTVPKGMVTGILKLGDTEPARYNTC